MNKYIVNKWINMACEYIYIYIIHVYIYIYNYISEYHSLSLISFDKPVDAKSSSSSHIIIISTNLL